MVLLPVNVLVYAFRRDASDHSRYHRWLEECVGLDHAFGVSDMVLAGFLRLVTHPRVFNPPAPIETALKFVQNLRQQPNCLEVRPGPRHWEVFTGLCRRVSAKGNLIPYAYLAALAIESGCEWITTDRDYSRFPGLRWRQPLDWVVVCWAA